MPLEFKCLVLKASWLHLCFQTIFLISWRCQFYYHILTHPAWLLLLWIWDHILWLQFIKLAGVRWRNETLTAVSPEGRKVKEKKRSLKEIQNGYFLFSVSLAENKGLALAELQSLFNKTPPPVNDVQKCMSTTCVPNFYSVTLVSAFYIHLAVSKGRKNKWKNTLEAVSHKVSKWQKLQTHKRMCICKCTHTGSP